jgi:formylglycine-generating enzyme required for sulfatase activity
VYQKRTFLIHRDDVGAVKTPDDGWTTTQGHEWEDLGPKAMADIFISYAREDRAKAQKLAEALDRRGWTVWWDTRLRAGEIWDEVIETQLKAARATVVLWSRSSVKSRWVRKEARAADVRHILAPAFLQRVELPLEFSDVQAADLINWEGDQAHPGFAQLLDDIAVALVEAPPRERVAEPEAKLEKPAQRTVEPKVIKAGAPRDLSDLAVFRDIDAPWCPEMVALPLGEFLMGSPEEEEGRFSDEGPQHRVTISCRFAIGRYPVTFDEYDHFCAATGRQKPKDRGWGRGRRPVIHVSWRDAVAYCAWLASETGQPYRLASEAEWEYAARGGTTTRYAFGDAITPKNANSSESKRGKSKTTEMGSYPPNAWGLYDMHGNVWEWVEDIYHDSYKSAPIDGSTWTDGEGQDSSRGRVVRGGSWLNVPGLLRSARRDRNPPDGRNNRLGFRVARTLD